MKIWEFEGQDELFEQSRDVCSTLWFSRIISDIWWLGTGTTYWTGIPGRYTSRVTIILKNTQLKKTFSKRGNRKIHLVVIYVQLLMYPRSCLSMRSTLFFWPNQTETGFSTHKISWCEKLPASFKSDSFWPPPPLKSMLATPFFSHRECGVSDVSRCE